MKTMKKVVAVAFTLALTAVQTASAKTVDLGGNPRVYSVGHDAGCYECQSGGMMMLVR